MKKPKSTKTQGRNAVIAVIVITAISAAGVYLYNQSRAPIVGTSEGVTSGPFEINNETYKLGEYVFMVVTGLQPTDVGHILVFAPNGRITTVVPFNGTLKSDFNTFFKPNTDVRTNLCTPQDLVGNWTIEFQGTTYRSIQFQVINEWIPGAQAEIKKAC